MGAQKGIQFIELRLYDDPKNPNSAYMLLAPATVLKNIFDSRTGYSLDRILAGVTGFCVCGTPSATAEKAVPLAGFALTVGARFTVKFTYASTVAGLTFNVDGTGAKPVYYRGVRLTQLVAGIVYEFIYTGANYEPVGSIPGYGY